jgi:hypothetical protein
MLDIINGGKMDSTEPTAKLTKEEKKEQKNIVRINARIKDLVATGLSEEEATQQVDEEEFDKMPIDQKLYGVRLAFIRLQNMLVKSMQAVGGDLAVLSDNNSVVAGSMDVNFLAVSLALESLGVTSAKQDGFIEEARAMISQRPTDNSEASMVKGMVDEEPPKIIS